MTFQTFSQKTSELQSSEPPDYRSLESGKRLTFGKNNGFQVELRRRVDEYFRSTGQPERDCPQMYVKTVILLLSFAALYVFLVFFAQAWWQALPLAILLGVVAAGIGFNIQHDGRHQAYSNSRWVNKLAGMTLDLIGGSSYTWHWQHDVFHHTYVNIQGHDPDIDIGVLGRLCPHQQRFSFHRWQHYYLWPLYGLVSIKWQLYSDFHNAIMGRIGEQQYPRPKGWELVIFLAGKAIFLTLAFGIPLFFHPIWVVLVFYAVAAIVSGMVLSIVFQLAHAVEEAGFPLPQEDTRQMDDAWAIHQVETTVDFARNSRIMCWLLGGLNFQVEHHLFPRICHIHYPAISPLVEETCREFGVKYKEHESFWAGVKSHFRWLRRMGMPEQTT